ESAAQASGACVAAVEALRAGYRRRREQRPRLAPGLARARVSVCTVDANLWGQARRAVGAQEALVHVALGDEQGSLAAGVLPVEGILAGVGATRSQPPVRASRTVARAGSVAAHEDDDRHRLQATAVALRVDTPPSQEVVVALELRRPAVGRETVVPLHQDVDRGGCIAGDLQDGIRAQRLEAIHLGALA